MYTIMAIGSMALWWCVTMANGLLILLIHCYRPSGLIPGLLPRYTPTSIKTPKAFITSVPDHVKIRSFPPAEKQNKPFRKSKAIRSQIKAQSRTIAAARCRYVLYDDEAVLQLFLVRFYSCQNWRSKRYGKYGKLK